LREKTRLLNFVYGSQFARVGDAGPAVTEIEIQVFSVFAIKHFLKISKFLKASTFLPSLVSLTVENPVQLGYLVGLLL
jgi:hypothetical protein